MRIGLLSDTHGWLDPKLLEFFEGCDEVWHCGDIGTMEVAEELERHFIVRAVYGNIDGGMMRRVYPETDVFTCEGVKVLMRISGTL